MINVRNSCWHVKKVQNSKVFNRMELVLQQGSCNASTALVSEASRVTVVILASICYPFFFVYENTATVFLKNLFLKGPAWGSFGFWQSRPASDICAEYTKYDASFWYVHPEECLKLIETRFVAFKTMCEATMLLLVVYQSFNFFWLTWCLHRALSNRPLAPPVQDTIDR